PKPRLRASGLCGGNRTSRAREIKPERESVHGARRPLRPSAEPSLCRLGSLWWLRNAYGGWKAVTVPTTTGARSGIPTDTGKAPRVAGVIRGQSQTGLTPSYLGRGPFFDVGSRARENIPETLQGIV